MPAAERATLPRPAGEAGVALAAPASRRPSRRAPAWVVLLLSALAALTAVAASVAIGSHPLSPAEVWHALVVHDASSYATTVVDSRIPRTVLGVLCGGALAVAGVVMQGLTRNPLGDPSLLGVNAGAAASLVVVVLVTGSTAVVSPFAALPGAVAAAVIAYALGGGGRSRAGSARLVLAGAVITALAGAFVQAVSLVSPETFGTVRFWQVGSIAGRGPEVIGAVLPVLVVGLLLAAALAPSLNLLALGDQVATALGARVGPIKLGALAATTLLCAGATAAAGPILFVGLAVPHLMRSLTGDDNRWLLPTSFFGGIALVLASDVIGRVLLAPNEIMAGIITALVGAPVLVVAVPRMRGMG